MQMRRHCTRSLVVSGEPKGARLYCCCLCPRLSCRLVVAVVDVSSLSSIPPSLTFCKAEYSEHSLVN